TSLVGFGSDSPFVAASTAAPAPGAAPHTSTAAYSAAPPAQNMTSTLLYTWASVATIIALWLWINRTPQPGHTESLPDDGVKVGNAIISPLESLSERQILRLGETRRFGNLEVTAVKIENRPIEIRPDGDVTTPVLVMTLSLRNVSETQTFHPTDPVFFYYHEPPKKLNGFKMFPQGYTYSYLHSVDNVRKVTLPYDLFYGNGMHFDEQAFKSIGPGETLETVVVSEEDAAGKLAPEMIWRVKLRKGKTSAGKGVATVVGVQFRKDQVKKA
ncbi:MAG: hypothetical protein ACRDD1_05375, partial [Planctomycetia bacterium]